MELIPVVWLTKKICVPLSFNTFNLRFGLAEITRYYYKYINKFHEFIKFIRIHNLK